MRIYDNLVLKGNCLTTMANGNKSIDVVPCSRHDYIKVSNSGDFVHATPYRHIRVYGSGSFYRINWRWVNKPDPWVLDFRVDSPYVPTFNALPYVSYAQENYIASLSLVTPSALSNLSDNRCLENCAKGKFALGNTLVELCESVSLITTSFESLIRVMVDIKHGRYSNALKQLGIRKSYMSRPLAQRWLEAQLAIKPMIGEIEQARRLARDAHIDIWHCITATGTAKERKQTYVSGRLTDSVARLTTDARWSISDYDLRYLMELNLANPAELLWEVLPLSWVVDYVVGVGDWIKQLLAPMGCVHITTSRSLRVKVTQNHFSYTPPTISGQSKSTQTTQGSVFVDGFQRTPSQFAPIPHLEYKLPLNATQLINIGTLISLFANGLRSPN